MIGDEYEGGLYKKIGIYRPTYNSTMSGTPENGIEYQFGPVNTYHLTASLKIRTSESDPGVVDLWYTNNTDVFYEWTHYSIDDFYDEWDPSEFAK